MALGVKLHSVQSLASRLLGEVSQIPFSDSDPASIVFSKPICSCRFSKLICSCRIKCRKLIKRLVRAMNALIQESSSQSHQDLTVQDFGSCYSHARRLSTETGRSRLRCRSIARSSTARPLITGLWLPPRRRSDILDSKLVITNLHLQYKRPCTERTTLWNHSGLLRRRGSQLADHYR